MTPSTPNPGKSRDSVIRDLAAQWVVRQDRTLSTAERVELESWLAADPRHARAFTQSSAAWRTFRGLGQIVGRAHAPEPAPLPRSPRPMLGVLAAAAAIVLVSVVALRSVDRDTTSVPNPALTSSRSVPTKRALADGSLAWLKGDAEILEAFTAGERRIRLLRGEAFFTVTKDPARPFLVEAGKVTVRAIGTAFAVRVESESIDVLVTEGTVQVTPPPETQASTAAPLAGDASARVEAGHRARVASSALPYHERLSVRPVSAAEIARSLAWYEPMLELAGATLKELVAAFARESGRRIEIADTALGEVRIGGRFPTQDVDGFVRVLEEIYDVKSERRSDGTLVLRAGRSGEPGSTR
ncbi:MAG: FecR domain-containing protein [Opitutaceae bacterium]|nr:FecR domain-containing protein [Opitutaceae bacterium]